MGKSERPRARYQRELLLQRERHASDTWKCGSFSFTFTHLPEDKKMSTKIWEAREVPTEAAQKQDLTKYVYMVRVRNNPKNATNRKRR